MSIRGMKRLAVIACAFCLFACGGCGEDDNSNNDGENDANAADNSFVEPVGEWSPETCDSPMDDDGDGVAGCGDPDCYTADPCAFDVAIGAPSMPTNGVHSFWQRWKWLFEAGGPQRGVVDGTITESNIGTVTGRVASVDGEPLAGAAVAFAGHPDLGRTYTRDDGTFDLAFDASRRLVVRVSAEGHITSDRGVRGVRHHSTAVDDVVLVPHESEATSVDFSTTTFIEGTATRDEDGPRRTAVVIPAGVRAKLSYPNGASRPLDEMTVRATEVTVGETGRDAMMAELPPGTLYTYAAEFSVDEAVAERAEGVDFDRPVFVYVDNFLDFDPGTLVPSGFYDRRDLAWQPMPDGVVVEIATLVDGKAVLSTGDDTPPRELYERLDVSEDERALLAEHFDVGDTLWRVPTRHFSPFRPVESTSPSNSDRVPSCRTKRFPRRKGRVCCS